MLLTRQVATAQRERFGENYFPCSMKHRGLQVAWQRDYKDDVQE